MKRIFILLCVSLLSLAGCSKSADTAQPAKPTAGEYTDSQEYLISPSGDENMCESKDSYYYLYNNFIYVIDKNTQKAAVLCSKPNCAHEYESNTTKCNGYLSGRGNLRYYDGWLYADSEEERYDADGNLHYFAQIFRISPDGTSRDLVYETDEMGIYDLKTHRGYFYFTACEYGDENTGDIESSSDMTHLYRMPIEGGEPQRLKIKYYEKRRDSSKALSSGYDVMRQHFFGDYLYIRYSGNVDGKGGDGLARVNLDTLETEEISNKLNLDFTIVGSKLYYVFNNKVYEADADGKNKKSLVDLKPYGYNGGYTVFSGDGRNITVNCYKSDTPKKNEGVHYLLINCKSKSITEYDLPVDCEIGGTPECVLAADFDGRVKGKPLYYIDKTKLNTKSYCKRIYEFNVNGGN